MNPDFFTQAIFSLYPQVIVVRGNVAYDDQDNEVEYDKAAVEEKANQIDCKQTATQILNATDWTSIGDVGDPAKSNPYLINQSEFIAYRSTVRNYAVNPVVDPVWPTPPTEQWSS